MSQRYKYGLAIASIFKNESHILDEWLSYYRKHGVERFYLVNNASNDNYQQQLDAHIDVITLLHDTRRGCQVQIFNELILPIAQQEAKWLLVVDLDEFVYNPRGQMLNGLLEQYTHVAGVSAPWVFFGSSGHVQQPESVIAGFTKRMFYGDGKWVNVKNFYQTRYLDFLYPHHAILTGDAPVISSKSKSRIFNGRDLVTEQDLTSKRFDFLCNHYAIQSLDFFTKIKSTRGDVYGQHLDSIRNFDYFRNYDHNDIIDRTLLALTDTHMVPIDQMQIEHVIIGFPSPLANKIRRHLDINSQGLNPNLKIYYNPTQIYQSIDSLLGLQQQYPLANYWIVSDTAKNVLLGYWMETRSEPITQFNKVYNTEHNAVQSGKIAIEATSLLKYGELDEYIKQAKKIFSKLKTLNSNELIDKF